MTAPRVGDVVAWDKVPDGALVREQDGAVCARFGDRYQSALYRPADWGYDAGGWWDLAATGLPVTIIALGLTGQESADDLRRLAEVFEVQKALQVYRPDTHALWCASAERRWPPRPESVVARGATAEAAQQLAAERLHAAGWRPGMSAEDAARLLEQAGGAS